MPPAVAPLAELESSLHPRREQYSDWVSGVQALYDEMVVITITPTWAKLLDFETTLPESVEDLIRKKQHAG